MSSKRSSSPTRPLSEGKIQKIQGEQEKEKGKEKEAEKVYLDEQRRVIMPHKNLNIKVN